MLNKLLEDKKYISTSLWINEDYDIFSNFLDVIFYNYHCVIHIINFESPYTFRTIDYEEY